MSSFGFRVFTLALAVFFFFETAIAGIKSASVYAENGAAGGKKSGFLKPGIGGKSVALQGGSKRLRIPIAPYKFRNQKRNLVLNPSRDVVTRGGMWSQQNLKDWAELQKKNLGKGRFFVFDITQPPSALVGTPALSFVQMGGGGPGGPPGTGRNPWEFGGGGGGPGMGGMGSGAPGTTNQANGAGAGAFSEVNTNTGNHLFIVPLFGWTSRGGMPIGITLYHNSMNNESGRFGKGWSWSFNMKVEASGSSAFVWWPEGLIVPYEYDSQTQTYNSPPGNHDTLVKNQDNTWTLTTKSQTVFEFDTAGRLTEIVDRNGNTITLTRDEHHRVTSVEDATGRYLTINYGTGEQGKAVSVEDPQGRVWSFTYDAMSGTLTSITYPEINEQNPTQSFGYDNDFNITSQNDLRGKVWTYSYDSGEKLLWWEDPYENRWTFTWGTGTCKLRGPEDGTNEYRFIHTYSEGVIVQVEDAAAKTEDYTWDSNRNLIEIEDRRGKVWEFSYDSKGNVLTAINPLEKTWTFSYTSENDLLTVEDPLENLWELVYWEGTGNLKQVIDPLERTRFTLYYNGYGQLNKIEDINENEINFAFNTHGHVNRIQDQLGKETEATYDLMGRLLTVVTPLNRTYTVQYDDWGRPERLLFPQVYNEGTEQWETHDVSVEYDHGSLITLLRDEPGRETTLLYDDAMRLIEVMNAEEQTMSFDYYDSGALRYFTNGRGKTTTYIYNSRWELFELYLPDNSQDPYESFQYDEDGNLAGYQNALGQIIGYEYDQAGRLTLIDYPTGTDTSISYDDAGRVTSVSDLSGTTSWAYNEAYELIALSTPQGGLEYEYDNLGRLWKLIKNETATTEYGYDDASRLVSILNPYNELTEFEYDDDSKLIRKLFANGTKEEYSYDERNRLLGIVLKKSNDDVLSTHEYVYDAVSNIVQRTSNGVTTEFTYDLIDQLLAETKQGYSAEYTYDANGNRLTRTVDSVTETYEYDDADKLLSVSINENPVKEYTYDDCGRLIEVESSAGTTYLQWDIRNRLTQITYPNSSTNTFGYNGFGARISKSDSTGNYTFMRNGTGVTAPVLSDSYAEYTPGISERRSSNSKFYHSDLKNTTAQTNSDQNITGTNHYDAFGNLIDYSGSWNGPFAYGGKFGYQSDDDSGLMLLGHRYYDSSTGRFLSRDPIGDGSNWFAYCSNNPVKRTDPSGLMYVIIIIDATGFGSAIAIAEAGDILGYKFIPGVGLVPIVAEGGEIIEIFPVSNVVDNAFEDPHKVGGGGPFPSGEYEITGVEHGRGMGPNFIVFRGDHIAGKRGTWLHSGAGEKWWKKTQGCIRAPESSLDKVCSVYIFSRNNGNRHRVIVHRTTWNDLIKKILTQSNFHASVSLPVMTPFKGPNGGIY